MNQELPPFSLVKVWLDIQYQDTPQYVKDKRLKLLIYYFGSIESATKYVKDTDNYQRAS